MCSRGYFISLAEEFWLYPETKKATLKKSKCSLNSSNSSCIKFKKKKKKTWKKECLYVWVYQGGGGAAGVVGLGEEQLPHGSEQGELGRHTMNTWATPFVILVWIYSHCFCLYTATCWLTFLSPYDWSSFSTSHLAPPAKAPVIVTTREAVMFQCTPSLCL